MSEKNFNQQESLLIINTMIDKAKGNIGQNTVFYLLWGWLVFLSALGQYILSQVGFEFPWLPWPILMTGGAIAAIIIGSRMEKKHKGVGYLDRVSKYLWGAFTVTLSIILINAIHLGWHHAYAVMVALYGLATFTSGGLLQFRPLIIGGISAWVLSLIAFYVDMENTLILVAISMVTAYLIPGYMLKAKHGKKA